MDSLTWTAEVIEVYRREIATYDAGRPHPEYRGVRQTPKGLMHAPGEDWRAIVALCDALKAQFGPVARLTVEFEKGRKP